MLTAEQCYEPNPELRNYYQGDVLSGIPFPSLPTFLPAAKQEVWGILRPLQRKGRTEARPIAEVLRNLPNELIGRAARDVPDAWTLPEGEYVIAGCKKRTVIMVTRGCDIDKESRKHLLVAPVIAISDLHAEQRTAERLRALRENEIFHWFYLPQKASSLPESYADLTQMVPLHRSFFDEVTLRTSLLARLSARGTILFQSCLSNFYGTRFGFSPEDKCPQTGRYACASCFHSRRGEPYSRDFDLGAVFGYCGNCREEALWVKMPEGY